jgi:hypothetical protein
MQDATNTNLGSGKGCPSLLSSAATSYEHRLTSCQAVRAGAGAAQVQAAAAAKKGKWLLNSFLLNPQFSFRLQLQGGSLR